MKYPGREALLKDCHLCCDRFARFSYFLTENSPFYQLIQFIQSIYSKVRCDSKDAQCSRGMAWLGWFAPGVSVPTSTKTRSRTPTATLTVTTTRAPSSYPGVRFRRAKSISRVTLVHIAQGEVPTRLLFTQRGAGRSLGRGSGIPEYRLPL